MKLVQLPNGDWLDPTVVRSLRVLPLYKCEVTGQVHGPRVVVETGIGNTSMYSVLNFERQEDADDYRDKLAVELNSAR